MGKSRQYAAHLRGGPKDGEVQALETMVSDIIVPIMPRSDYIMTEKSLGSPWSLIHQGRYTRSKRLSDYSAEFEWDGFTCPHETRQPADSTLAFFLPAVEHAKVGKVAAILKEYEYTKQISAATVTDMMRLLADVRDGLRSRGN